jgi:outer membrane protein assembly factor BamE
MNKFLTLALAGVVMVGCGSFKNPIERITPHKIPVQQGNAITQEMLNKLKPGMTPSQVRFILGTPLVVEPFRDDRWDYVHVLRKGDQVVEQRRVSVVFENGLLKGVEGDVQAAASKDAPANKEERK